MVKYCITSGNSKTGLATIRALRDLGENDIVAGARDVAKSQARLQEAGASQVVYFDFTKTESIRNALKGVERVLLVHPNAAVLDEGIPWNQTFCEIATEAGSTVKMIARMSGAVKDPTSPNEMLRFHGVTDNFVKDTGLLHAFIGPNFFMENWIMKADDIKSGCVIGAAGEGRATYVAASDIGRVAACVLREPEKYNGQHLVITGPEAVTEAECVQAISEATGKPAKYVNISPDELKSRLEHKGLPPKLIDTVIALENIKSHNFASEVSPVVRDVTGKDPISMKVWAKENTSFFK